ncbi:MAG: hypothetical protein ACREBF_04750 [Candidatus Micrarchaeales archaeon]
MKGQKQQMEQIFLGTSYSERFAQQRNIRLSSVIKTRSDARFIPTNHTQYANERAIGDISGIILKFDEFAKRFFDNAKEDIEAFKALDKKEILQRFLKGHDDTGKLIQVFETVLSDGEINPITFVNARRHFVIANIFVKKLQGVDLDKIVDDGIKLEEKDRIEFELGMFAGLEPLFVTTMLSSLKEDDYELNHAYGILVDRYSNFVARTFPEEYIKASGLDKPSYSVAHYHKFLDYLEAERHEPILL